ncbi:hypothetical protein CIPAW_05G233600 [Carya illinoinensis]|uniref:Uncharacterized protein n=1 Tax=Carya illinoinensis TaxID=32201 RepID=A0A8T1QNK7_CARIL|nr:hypothetical protein CIPAW_05G233600 [Carya illinoinensis]KAG6655694.1 hypothetical protein CIPAW_05G233600 [Carya illinoinensis]
MHRFIHAYLFVQKFDKNHAITLFQHSGTGSHSFNPVYTLSPVICRALCGPFSGTRRQKGLKILSLVLE